MTKRVHEGRAEVVEEETKEDNNEHINDANSAICVKERRKEAESTLKRQKRQLSWEIPYSIFSSTYNDSTVQLELVLEIYHLLVVSGSALVNRVTRPCFPLNYTLLY